MSGHAVAGGHLAGKPAPAGDYDADILILSLDRVAETEAAIQSVLGQTGLSRHLIVFDQGSSEATLARLRAVIEPHENAQLTSAGGNLGVAEGRNRAAALGHGRMLIALDNDAVFADSSTAARAVALLDEQPQLAALGFRIMNGDGSDEDHASWGYPEALRPRAADRFASATFVGAGHAIRRATWDAVGGYDSALFFTWEEYDFALRAIDQGWQLLHAGDIAVHHKLASEGRLDWSGRRWFLFIRNRLYIARKWRTPLPALLARAAAYCLKSMRLGLTRQAWLAVTASFQMPLSVPPRRMSAGGRAYLGVNDTAWRGGFWFRFRAEVATGLPSTRQRQMRNTPVTTPP
ncbi:glycosyltransferase family 2 protein [Acidisoma sp.]|uniref:glycosyltransferase family 2 protein n=1 Tax=Acidisoma sp. TaxID=1872115 RepID=UPI003B006D3E